jgi:hypothetical protein
MKHKIHAETGKLMYLRRPRVRSGAAPLVEWRSDDDEVEDEVSEPATDEEIAWWRARYVDEGRTITDKD